MPNGSSCKTGAGRGRTGHDQLPIGSEEVLLSSKAVVTTKRLNEREFVHRVEWCLMPYDFSYSELLAGLEEALRYTFPKDGCRLTRGGPFTD